MLKIGLTGGIGSGKTTVAKIFEMLGIPVYYTDEEAKRIMNEDEALKALLVKHFGEETYLAGKLNRPYLASVVFNDTEKIKLLNSLVHPVTIAHAEEWFSRQQAPYVIKEAALMFESDAWKAVDKVIGVSTPMHLRLQRAMQRDGSTEASVRARMDKQMNEEEKMKRCDFIIYNDEQQMVIPQVLSLHEKLLLY